jgi:putative glutamine amidotransferase
MINVALGGTLYQDIDSQLPGAIEHRNAERYDSAVHEVVIEKGSGLARLYPGVESAQINTIHHQAVKTLGKGLLAEAWSEPDRVVEAIRHSGDRYVFGVQWHPEFYVPGSGGQLDPTPILDEFLGEAKKRLK